MTHSLCAAPGQEDLNAVVMNYLITEGYAKAAAQFQEESRTAGEHVDKASTPLFPPHTRLLPAPTPAGLDLSTVGARMGVHQSVVSGDCGAAVEGCNALDPGLLEARRDLLFALHRQHLVELIRRGDVDAALSFAQEYLAPLAQENVRVACFCSFARLSLLTPLPLLAKPTQPEFRPELERAMALLAFENEAQAAAVSPALAALWAPEARHLVASQLNAAILVSQGQESEPRLPGLLKRLRWTEQALAGAGRPVPHFSLPSGGAPQDRTDAGAPALTVDQQL